MSISSQIQQLIVTRLGEVGVLRAAVPVVAWREQELAVEIEAVAMSGLGLGVHVMPPLPMSAIDDAPFVFFDRAEVRVRIFEQPALNGLGVDVYQLAEDVINGLHWNGIGAVLSHPLQLAAGITETVPDAAWRIVDVLFTAAYQLPVRNVPATTLAPAGRGISDDLQSSVVEQLTNGLVANTVPVFRQRMHDLEAETEAAGHPIKIEVLSPLPTSAMTGNPSVFFEGYEVRVRITEQPALNGSSVDAFDLVEDVATTLHWQPFTGLLAHPLQISAKPVARRDNAAAREIDVVFNAICGFAAE